MNDDIKRRIFDRCKEMEGPLDTPCLIWTGGKINNHQDYGRIKYRSKDWIVHRLVYELCVGPIPPGMQVNHECYQQDCVRPEHLKLGDHNSNMRDMVRHGRSLAGEAHPQAILKREQVAEILKMAGEGKDIGHLSRRFDVGIHVIQAIVCGKTWRDVPGPRITPPPRRRENRFYGVRYHKSIRKWQAIMRVNGKKKYFGTFPYELLAACCVNAHIAWLGLNKPLNVIDADEWAASGIYD